MGEWNKKDDKKRWGYKQWNLREREIETKMNKFHSSWEEEEKYIYRDRVDQSKIRRRKNILITR